MHRNQFDYLVYEGDSVEETTEAGINGPNQTLSVHAT